MVTVQQAKKFVGKLVLMRQTKIDSLILPHNMIATIHSVSDEGVITFGTDNGKTINVSDLDSIVRYA